MNEKFISVLTVISHYMVFLYQSKWQGIGYTLWVIPDGIWVSRDQSCWCVLLLRFSLHIVIVHQGHIWYFKDTFHWWRHSMLIDYLEGTNFHHFGILMLHPVWYLLHAFFWHCVCCVKTFIWIHQWWVTSAIFLVVGYVTTWVQEMVGHHIHWWGCPSWDCMMYHHHWTIFFVLLLRQGARSHIFLVSFFWILLHPLWFFSAYIILCFLHSELFLCNHCRWCGQYLFRGFVFSIFLRHHHP